MTGGTMTTKGRRTMMMGRRMKGRTMRMMATGGSASTKGRRRTGRKGGGQWG